ncbi:MAG: FHA domain-containing protein [Pirellulaceae bacterium]
MNAILSLDQNDISNEFALHEFPVLIGRSLDASITLNDRWVSRRHCEIVLCDDRLMVRDLGSKHGTFVNDCGISESPLLPGDRLTVGLSTFVASYEIDGEKSPGVESATLVTRE